MVYWTAFTDLQTERVGPRATIPVNAIFAYADRVGLDRDRLKRIVWEVDKTLLDHWKEQDKADEAKRKAEAQKPAQIPGGSS